MVIINIFMTLFISFEMEHGYTIRSEKNMFEYYGHIDEPRLSIFFINHNLLSISIEVFPSNGILTVS